MKEGDRRRTGQRQKVIWSLGSVTALADLMGSRSPPEWFQWCWDVWAFRPLHWTIIGHGPPKDVVWPGARQFFAGMVTLKGPASLPTSGQVLYWNRIWGMPLSFHHNNFICIKKSCWQFLENGLEKEKTKSGEPTRCFWNCSMEDDDSLNYMGTIEWQRNKRSQNIFLT